ncbi:hypothetical protein K435DRAFT_874066 [Dendrothele bispora CBS 962.96]|uniref:Fungal-type protein kinase domain-containing protein n=1 Tax=Dendrothele bispora (strain CBS 962.96) TaxID=1314807 RepID=A0A4S8KXK4_DENBC|nr:hypothetical protein K435DRAFT_874066 [Dendrothele bispora CBS 962.96]
MVNIIRSQRIPRQVRAVACLAEERQLIEEDIVNHLIEVEPSVFLENYTNQSLWNDKIESCIQELTTPVQPDTKSNLPEQTAQSPEGLLDDHGHWTIFPEDREDEPENIFYQRVLVVSQEVCKWAMEHLGLVRTASLCCRPHNSTDSEIEGSSFYSDALWILEKPVDELEAEYFSFKGGNHVPSSSVSANGEWKLYQEDTIDNRRKVIGAANHYLNNDPTRGHFYSMTIEDYNVTLWFYSRSHCARSTGFDLRTDPRSLIKFILAMSFNTKEELGFAPYIIRQLPLNKDAHIEYTYQVDDDHYRTVKAIRDTRPTSFCGRATRTWTAYDLADTGQSHVVVKEFSEVSGTLQEWQILGNILGKLKGLNRSLQNCGREDLVKGRETLLQGVNPEKLTADVVQFLKSLDKEDDLDTEIENIENHKRYFVSIIGHAEYKQPHCREQEEQATCELFPSSLHMQHVAPARTPGSSRVDESSRYPPRPARPRKPLRTRKLSRYVVVYQEVCIPLQDLKDTAHIWPVIRDALIATRLLYFIGYVHRDLSPGNVYYDPKTKTGRLSDFEYARPVNENSDKLPRTGTAGFISYEIQTQGPLFPSSDDSNLEDSAISHRYIHDLESILWLAIWIVSTRALDSRDDPSCDNPSSDEPSPDDPSSDDPSPDDPSSDDPSPDDPSSDKDNSTYLSYIDALFANEITRLHYLLRREKLPENAYKITGFPSNVYTALTSARDVLSNHYREFSNGTRERGSHEGYRSLHKKLEKELAALKVKAGSKMSVLGISTALSTAPSSDARANPAELQPEQLIRRNTLYYLQKYNVRAPANKEQEEYVEGKTGPKRKRGASPEPRSQDTSLATGNVISVGEPSTGGIQTRFKSKQAKTTSNATPVEDSTCRPPTQSKQAKALRNATSVRGSTSDPTTLSQATRNNNKTNGKILAALLGASVAAFTKFSTTPLNPIKSVGSGSVLWAPEVANAGM